MFSSYRLRSGRLVACSSDSVRGTTSVTDYAVDDPDSSHCAHANSVLRADRDNAADVTAAAIL